MARRRRARSIVFVEEVGVTGMISRREIWMLCGVSCSASESQESFCRRLAGKNCGLKLLSLSSLFIGLSCLFQRVITIIYIDQVYHVFFSRLLKMGNNESKLCDPICIWACTRLPAYRLSDTADPKRMVTTKEGSAT